MYLLFWYIFYFLLIVADGALGFEFNVLSGIFALATMLPTLAVAVRRLHDTGRSGWWLFISLIPLVGAIWLFVLFCLKGSESERMHMVRNLISESKMKKELHV